MLRMCLEWTWNLILSILSSKIAHSFHYFHVTFQQDKLVLGIQWVLENQKDRLMLNVETKFLCSSNCHFVLLTPKCFLDNLVNLTELIHLPSFHLFYQIHSIEKKQFYSKVQQHSVSYSYQVDDVISSNVWLVLPYTSLTRYLIIVARRERFDLTVWSWFLFPLTEGIRRGYWFSSNLSTISRKPESGFHKHTIIDRMW